MRLDKAVLQAERYGGQGRDGDFRIDKAACQIRFPLLCRVVCLYQVKEGRQQCEVRAELSAANTLRRVREVALAGQADKGYRAEGKAMGRLDADPKLHGMDSTHAQGWLVLRYRGAPVVGCVENQGDVRQDDSRFPTIAFGYSRQGQNGIDTVFRLTNRLHHNAVKEACA